VLSGLEQNVHFFPDGTWSVQALSAFQFSIGEQHRLPTFGRLYYGKNFNLAVIERLLFPLKKIHQHINYRKLWTRTYSHHSQTVKPFQASVIVTKLNAAP